MEEPDVELKGTSYRVSRSKAKPKWLILKRLSTGFVIGVHLVLIKYQMILEKLGKLIVKFPGKIICTLTLLTVVSWLGFLTMIPPNLKDEFWVSEDSRLVKDLKKAMEVFPSLQPRREEVIVEAVAKKGENVLSGACLEDALLVHKTVVNLDNFQSFCMQARNNWQSTNHSCMMTNPLEVCDLNENESDRCIQSIAREWNEQLGTTLSDGRSFTFNQQLFFGGFTSKNSSTKKGSISAKAIRMVYYLKNPSESGPSGNDILSWEASFLQKMEELRPKMKCALLFFTSSQNHESVASLLFSFRSAETFVTFAVLLCSTIVLVNCTLASFRPVAIILGCLITACVVIGLVSSVSLTYLASINVWQSIWMVTIFMYCKGALDALILIREIHKQNHIPSLEHRIANCMTKSGMALTTSNLICILMFCFTQLSSFPVFRGFAVMALINVLYHFVIFFLLIMACLFCWLTKIHKCDKYIETDLTRDEMEEDERDCFEQIYGRIIVGKVGSSVIMMLFIGIIVFSSYVVLTPANQVFDSPLQVTPHTEATKYMIERRKIFEKETKVKIVFHSQLNYSDSGLRQKLQSFVESISSAPYSNRPVESWIHKFEGWAKMQNRSCTGTQFKSCLVAFLENPKNFKYLVDLNFTMHNDSLKFVASSFDLYVISSEQFSLRKKYLQSLKHDTADFEEQQHIPVAIVSSLLEETEQLITLEKECISFSAVAGISVLVLSLFLTANIRIVVVLAIGLVIQVLEMMALLNLWDVPLNYASVICISLGFIVSVNFSVHMSQVRALSVKNTAKKRTLDALNSVGIPILSGGLLAILSSIGLGFVFPNLSLIFLRVLPIHIVLGVFHSLGYIPSAIFITSKPMEACIRATVSPSFILSQEQLELKEHQKQYQESSCRETFKQDSKSSGVALLGISCRFPNAENKELFWDMLIKGKSGFQPDYPVNRPSEYHDYHMLYNPKRFTPGRLCALGGSYLGNIQDFNPEFFNISPQEAKAMDPQQRILLQTAYEAIEDAGLRLEDLQKGNTGVFVGAMNLDYSSRVMQPENRRNLNQFFSTGVTASILANRISFCLNLTGPSLTVDTACSSSLVALKIACDCLRNGECDVAIVCAPNIILDPSVQIIFSVGGLLAPDGRCKSFDASGDGYGRGEGFAAVILKLTDDAVMDKDDIYCEIVACSMNNDGQSAVPITAPSAKTQADLSQKVLEESGLHAEDIEYLEAHGTGTAIGDVVEIKSIATTYSRNASGNGRVLRVGSVKSNLNHTESASGLAGLIKVALMLKNKTLVPTINIKTLNPKFNLAEKGIKVQDICEPWTKQGKNPRTAAINSFGYGGTNVHAILQEYPETNSMPLKKSSRQNHVITLSAHSATALTNTAKQHAKWLRENFNDEGAKSDICWSLNTRRSQHLHRLAVVFDSLHGAADLLEMFGENSTGWAEHVSQGKAMSQHSRPVFVFGGQGANWIGMGRQLMDSEPLFRDTVSEISNMIQDLGETWSLESALLGQDSRFDLMGNIVGQPATFTLQYSTAKLLQSWGIFPTAVVGHSLGELVACCVAGALSLEEALKIILIRSKCHELCPTNGSMAALGMSAEDTSQLIGELRLEGSVSIAAVNDEKSVTISGDKLSIECVQRHLQLNKIQVFWRDLSTARAFHSFHVEMVKESFHSQMKSMHLCPQKTTIPLYSTVTGDIIPGEKMDANYWWSNFRQSVLFCQAVQNALRDNLSIFIEISAQPTLGYNLKRISEQQSLQSSRSTNVVYLPTHPRKTVKDQHKAFLHNTVSKLYTMGYSIDWDCVQGEEGSVHFIRTPSYPWQKTDYWFIQDEPTKSEGKSHFRRHPFLTELKPTGSFTGLHCWEVEVDLYQFPTLKDHALRQGGPVLPGSACVEMAIAMTVERFCCDEVEIKNVEFTSILTLPENQIRLLRLQLQDCRDIGTAEFQVKNISGDGSEILLARGEVTAVLGDGKLRKNPEQGSLEFYKSVNVETFQDITTRMKPVALAEFRHLTEKYGFNFGPSFSLIKSIWRGQEEAFCIIDIDREEVKIEMARYVAHPAFLDACFQSSAAVEEDTSSNLLDETTFPVGIKKLTFFSRTIPQRTFCYVSKQVRGNWVTYDINVMDSRGTILIAVEGFQSTEIGTLIRSQKFDSMAYGTRWVESEIEPQSDTEPAVRIVVNDSQAVGQLFCDHLKAKNPAARVITVHVPFENTDWPEDLKRELTSAMSSLATTQDKVQLFNFLPVDAGISAECYEAVDNSQMLAFVSCVKILQVIANSNLTSPHLVTVTRNSQVVAPGNETCCFPWACSVLGLRRTASLECPNIRCTAVDLSDDSADLILLAEEAQASSKEDEIAFRGGKRFVNRMMWLDKSSSQTTLSYKEKTLPSVYITLHPKTGALCFKKNTWPRLSGNQIRVNVTCSWIVSGDLKQIFCNPQFVGFSGNVCETAKESRGLKVGDEVCGMASISKVGNQVQVNADNVIHKPKGMSDKQAATVPVCLAVALYVLQKTLGKKKNQSLLIDNKKNGLGKVAVLVAEALGHTVVSAKRESKAHICPHITSAQGSMPENIAYHGRKIDAAIYFDQPKPKCLQATCQLLKEGGMLVICKDVAGSITIPAGKQITCERITFTEILLKPKAFPELWTIAWELLQSSGLMNEVFKLDQNTVDIVQKVQESRSEGAQISFDFLKTTCSEFVSLSFGRSNGSSEFSGEVMMPGIDQQGLKPDRTYMVVGGIQGFGFEVAKWMANCGAKSIVLIARSKPSESKLSEVSKLMEVTGANIILHQADASSPVCMEALKERLQSLPSVAGIVHTAMVLRDELIPSLTVSNFRIVAAPKVKAAYLLHEMSLSMDLDFFVLFSSIASLLGNPGQASYSAANAFLDGLAQYRQHVLGLPALSINWGPIKGVGVLHREEATAQHLSRAGYFLLPATQAINFMEKVLTEEPGRAQIGLFDVDWQRIQTSTPGLAKSTRLAYISDRQESTSSLQNKQEIASMLLMEKDLGRQQELAHQYVTELICSWTGNAPSDLNFNSSLYSYGMDSFAALTFKMQLESSLQISFEVFYFNQPDTTPAKLIQDIIGRLNNERIVPVQGEEEVLSKETTPQAEGKRDKSPQRANTFEEPLHPIDMASPTATYHLIPLFKPEQAEVKLFCVHPAGRYTMNLSPISNGFTQQSLVAFYGIGYTEPTMRAENRSVRKMAQSYVSMVKQVQRRGPYYLAGQSFGGLVAYEMANILTEQSENVAFVAMIDTFPWYLPNRTGAARLEMLFSGTKLDKLMDGLFEATFEQVLYKMATTNLKMTADEYKELRENEALEGTMTLLQKRAAAENIPLYDIRALRDSLHHDNKMATNKHREWKAPQVRFKGPITYLKSADQRYAPTRPLQEDSDSSWSLLVDGNIDVYICPGDHLALSDPDDGAVIGGILATAVGIRYRTLCPVLPGLSTTFKERRAIRKFESGVNVTLYARKVSKPPHAGTIFLNVTNKTLTFKSTLRRSDNPSRKSKEKKISIKEIRNILQGNHEPTALKVASKMPHTANQNGTINLALVTSVVTPKRAYNFEWNNFNDMREFYSTAEAILSVFIYKK